jgi:hypothetical protein
MLGQGDGTLPNLARGLVAACRRSATLTRPKPALTAPWQCMYRRVDIATVAAGAASPIG